MKTILTLEKIISFFRHNPSLNVNGVNDEAMKLDYQNEN